MSEREIKKFIRQEYALNGNTKIRNLNIEKQEFNLIIGDCMATLPFGKSLKRQIRINTILESNI